jgi:hypothetical protein
LGSDSELKNHKWQWNGSGLGHARITTHNYYLLESRQDSIAESTFAESTSLNVPAPRHSVKLGSNLVTNGRIVVLCVLCKVSATGKRDGRRGS